MSSDAIVDLANDVHKALDKSKSSLCVLLDLTKAFDTVSHCHLLFVMEDIGIRGVACDLLMTA